MEQTFTDQNFQTSVLASDKPVLVDFWAAWCGPCHTMAPVIAEIAEELDGKIVVGKLNVDEQGETAQAYSVMSIPTFLLFKGGRVVDQMVGVTPKDAMVERIMKHV
jgi:thioredoxin 1